jgi:hypothetical protein
MKHSNWILGIGILIAVLLLTGSFLLKSEPIPEAKSPIESTTQSTIATTAKTLVLIPLKEVSLRLFHIK